MLISHATSYVVEVDDGSDALPATLHYVSDSAMDVVNVVHESFSNARILMMWQVQPVARHVFDPQP